MYLFFDVLYGTWQAGPVSELTVLHYYLLQKSPNVSHRQRIAISTKRSNMYKS